MQVPNARRARQIASFLKVFFLFAAFCSPHASFGQDVPPALTFLKAAQIAQDTLQKQNLPQEYFLRTLSIVYPKDGGLIERYEARYEPVVRHRVMAGTEPDKSVVKYKVITIAMDGVATIDEKVIDRSGLQPRVIKAATPTPTQTETK